MSEIFAWLNGVLLAFTLVGLTLGTWLFRWQIRFPLLGSWFLWMFSVWWITMGYDQIGVYFELRKYNLDSNTLEYLRQLGIDMNVLVCKPVYPWYIESRLMCARFGVVWGIYWCFFYGMMRLRGVTFKDLARPIIQRGKPDGDKPEPE